MNAGVSAPNFYDHTDSTPLIADIRCRFSAHERAVSCICPLPLRPTACRYSDRRRRRPAARVDSRQLRTRSLGRSLLELRRTPVHTAGIPRLLAFALPTACSAASASSGRSPASATTSAGPAAAPSGTRTASRRASWRLGTGRSRSGPRSEISDVSMILSSMVEIDVL